MKMRMMLQQEKELHRRYPMLASHKPSQSKLRRNIRVTSTFSLLSIDDKFAYAVSLVECGSIKLVRVLIVHPLRFRRAAPRKQSMTKAYIDVH
jgi:hypothetical protein